MIKKASTSILIATILLTSSCFSSNSPTNTEPNSNKNTQTNDNDNQTTKPSVEEDKPPVLDGIKFDVNFGKTIVGGKILDAASRSLLEKKVSLTISGDDSDKLEKTELETNNGFIDLTFKSGIKPTESKPLVLTVVGHSEGYFSSSVPVVITSPEESSFELKLVNKQTPPEGITATEMNGKISSSGGLEKELKITSTEKLSNTTSSVTLPANTVMRDKDGNPLSGDINVDVAFYNNQSSTSLESFPGGLGFADVTTASGQEVNGYFETAGFVSVDIKDQSGKNVEKFDQPVTITMEINKDTINPDTGEKVKLGDQIDIWSHSVETGKWTNEGKGTVQNGSNGNFQVQYQVNHLSYWNMDWHYGTKCAPEIIMNWKTPNKKYPLSINFEFDGARRAFNTSGTIREDLTEITNVPADRPLKMTVYYYKNGKKEVIGTKTQTLSISNTTRQVGWRTQNNCNEQIVIDVTNPEDTLQTFVTGSLVFINKTNNKDIKIRPSIDFWYKAKSDNEWKRGRMRGGSSKLYVNVGQEYEFKILYGGQEYIRTYTFKKGEKRVDLEELDFRGLDYNEFLTNINN